MKGTFPAVATLLLSTAILLAGHGLQLTLLPMSADAAGFSRVAIGLSASAYFLGFVTGCLVAPRLVRRVGHIRMFAVFAALLASVILLLHLLVDVAAWFALRFVTGIAIAGAYLVIESWLNERASNETRGTLFSIYVIINLSVTMVGQQLVNVAPVDSATPFMLAAIAMMLAVVPVGMTLALQPAPVSDPKVRLGRLWSLSHVGVIGAVTSGLVTGAFWALGPVYAAAMDLTVFEITLFMSATVGGGALLQLPLGRLSDRTDRRVVVLGVLVAVALACVGLVGTPGGPLLFVLAFAFGSTSMSIYGLCVACANDRARTDEFVEVASGILLCYGAGAVVGPLGAALAMRLLGPGGLYAFCALAAVAAALLTFGRLRARSGWTEAPDEPFHALPRTSPAVFELDPRATDRRAT